MPLPTHLSNPSLLKAEAAEGCCVSVNTPGRHGLTLTKIRDPTIHDRRVLDRWLTRTAMRWR